MSAPTVAGTVPGPATDDPDPYGIGDPNGRPPRRRHATSRGGPEGARPLRGVIGLRRLRIRGKLNLLLVLALLAVVLVAVPFVGGQVGNAGAAARTSDAARTTEALGDLIWELQRERLVTVAFLALPQLDAGELTEQQGRVDSAAEAVRTALGDSASDELSSALVRLGSLEEPRQSTLVRGISPDRVARTYSAVTGALIDALRLVPQDSGDAEGTRQLAALDALLRADEFNALREMALIAAAVNPQTGLVLLADASAQAPLFIEQFVRQADAGVSTQVVQVDQGVPAQRIDLLAAELTAPPVRPAVDFVGEALPQAQTQLTARRAVQEKVITQIAETASDRAAEAARLALLVGVGAALLVALIAAVAITVSRSIARPLQRLTSAAADVADLAGTELARVTTGEASNEVVPHLPPIQVTTADEVGELAAAFNRVQATATDLVQQHAVRRNNDVSAMFANIAQRTQNLVGRQLALIDELERNEQNSELLSHLYRLDHLSTRLRRTADDLLVISGSPAESRIQGPVPLATALRSAVAEIEDYRRVEFGDVGDVVLGATLGSDAVLLFAELLDNATSYSPPDSAVEVGVGFAADGSCVVRIVDHGIGMSPERLAEENARLTERERAHLVPSGVLGLFVVGRLARQHSLMVRLLETAGGGITATVHIPADLYSRDARWNRPDPGRHGAPAAAQAPAALPADLPLVALPPAPASPAELPPAAAAAPPAAPEAVPAQQQAPGWDVRSLPDQFFPAWDPDGFGWFSDPEPQPAGAPAATAPPAAAPQAAAPAPHLAAPPVPAAPVPAPHVGAMTATAPPAARPHAAPPHAAPPHAAPPHAAPPLPARRPAAPGPDADPVSRGGLQRRVPGARLADSGVTPRVADTGGRGLHDAEAVRDVLDGYQSGVASAEDAHQPTTLAPRREASGLSRRVPGASLAPSLRRADSPPPPAPVAAAGPQQRDADAEFAAFDAFASGFAQVGRASTDQTRDDLPATPPGGPGAVVEPPGRVPTPPTPRPRSDEPMHGRNR